MTNLIQNLAQRQTLQQCIYAPGIEDTIQCQVEFQEKDQCFLKTLIRNFNAAKRTAYNRLRANMKVSDIEKFLQPQFQLQSRHAKDAIFEANKLIRTQKQQVQFRKTSLTAQ